MARSTEFFGIQVTLTASVANNLLKLLQAIDANIPAALRNLTFQLDLTATIGVVLLGDAAISSSRYGYSMTLTNTAPPASISLSTGEIQALLLGSFFLYTTASSIKVNVLGRV